MQQQLSVAAIMCASARLLLKEVINVKSDLAGELCCVVWCFLSVLLSIKKPPPAKPKFYCTL